MAGLVALAIPIGMLLLLSVGELSAEGPGALLHLLQAAPLLVFAVGAWRYPRAAGVVLLVVGGTLALANPSCARGPLEMKFSIELVLFLPPIVAGVLLVAAARAERARQLPDPR